MNFRNVLLFVITCGLVMGIAVVSFGAQKPMYTDGIDAAFPPFSYIDKNGDPTGFDVEVIKWIGREMGFDVKIVPVDWDAIIPTLKVGNIDLIASGMTINPKREKQVDFTTPYWKINLAVVVREVAGEDGAQVPQYNVFSAVAPGRTIGVQRGTTAQTWLQENLIDKGVDIKLKLYDNFLLAIEDLLIGRIDCAVIDGPTAQSAVADRKATIVGTINTGEIYGYAVRKGDTKLLNLLNEGLKRLQASPEWEKLVNKWLIGG
ncbi:MAG TPA: basic amino acid ABC transporter substrate-binding protein [Candidatus Acetothermia bacterium]|nr:basic amino acid ABC transporter substrate-binding protein [Candidatus Acetothermia bacterium]